MKNPKPEKPWKRALQIVERCKRGKRLCCYNQQTETGGAEIVYFLEPGGGTRRSEVGRERTKAQAANSARGWAFRCGVFSNIHAGAMSEPRDYYVSLRRGTGIRAKYSLLAGPYATHAEALSMVTPSRQEASRLDAWVDFDFIGTCSILRKPENKNGFLNVYLGVKPRELTAA